MEWKFENGRIYSLDKNGELMCEATFYKKENGEVDVDHTYVNPVLRGQGKASEMMKVVADYLRNENLKATASCSYANMWFKNNEKIYSDIISNDIYNEDIACKLDGKH